MSEPRDPNSVRKKRVMRVLTDAIRAGESQAGLAKKIGVKPPAITRWLDPDDNEPDPESIGKIADALGVPAGWLLGEMNDQERFVIEQLRDGRSVAGRILRRAVEQAVEEDAIERGILARDRRKEDSNTGGR